MPSQPIDLSSQITELFATTGKRKPTVSVDLGPLGVVRVHQDINTFEMLEMGSDVSSLSRQIADFVHEDDRAGFLERIRAVHDLPIEAVLGLYSAMLEVASGQRPTNSPSASSGGTRKKAVAKRSAARSNGRASTTTR